MLYREIAVLQRLQVGEFSEPVDSPVGFQIIRRSPNRERRKFALDSIRFGFDPEAPDVRKSSQASMREVALSAAQTLARDPSQFDRIKRELWPVPPEEWIEGRGSSQLTNSLANLKFGEIDPEPILEGSAYIIPRRVDPSGLPPVVETSFELPAPTSMDLDRLVATVAGSYLDTQLRAIANEDEVRAGLGPRNAEEFARLHRTLHFDQIADVNERIAAFHDLSATVRELLGPQRHEDYVRRLVTTTERALLKSAEP